MSEKREAPSILSVNEVVRKISEAMERTSFWDDLRGELYELSTIGIEEVPGARFSPEETRDIFEEKIGEIIMGLSDNDRIKLLTKLFGQEPSDGMLSNFRKGIIKKLHESSVTDLHDLSAEERAMAVLNFSLGEVLSEYFLVYQDMTRREENMRRIRKVDDMDN